MRRNSLVLVIAASFALACTPGSSTTGGGGGKTGPKVASVTLTASATSVVVGTTVQLTAAAKDAKGAAVAKATFTYASSDKTLATVSAAGVVTGVALGSVNVTATSGGVVSAPLALSVTPGSVTLAAAATTVAAGATDQLTAAALDANGNAIAGATFTYASSDSTLATVSADGVVTGVALGDVTVSATSGGVPSSPVSLSVVPASVALTAPATSVAIGATLPLSATAEDANGNALANATFTYASSDDTLATVSAEGVVTGVAVGSVDLTATSDGVVSAPVSLRIHPPVVATSITPDSGPSSLTATIAGHGFGAAAGSVAFGAAAAAVTSWSDTAIAVTVPDLGAGSVPVVVTTATGDASNALSFTVSTNPYVEKIVPPMLAQGVEGTVVVEGLNLAGAIGVDFDASGAADASITATVGASTATRLTLNVKVGQAAWGPRTVVVHTGANGDSTTSATGANQFYVERRTGSIWTVAGNGAQGSSGDGGPALQASLDAPRALAYGHGTVFVADQSAHCVRAFGVDALAPATMSTVAGTCGTSGSSGDGGSATGATLMKPSALAYDGSRDLLFVADQDDARVRVVNLGAAAATLGATTIASGAIATLAGNGTSGFAGDGADATAASLSSPQGLFLDANGVLFIADTGNGRVRAVETVDASLPAYAGVMLVPHQIETVAGNGSGTPVAGSAQATALAQPAGLAGDGTFLFIADKAAKELLAVNLDASAHALDDGTVTVAAGNLAIIGGAGTSTDVFRSPVGVAIDPAGGVDVVDGVTSQVSALATGVYVLYRSNASIFPGKVGTVAGNGTAGYTGDWGPAEKAELSGPLGLAVNDAGTRLFVADTANHVVREVSVAFAGDFFDGALGDLTLGPGSYALSTDSGELTGGATPVETGVTDGVFEFGNITLGAGATLALTGSQRAFLAASGTVEVDGTIDLSSFSGGGVGSAGSFAGGSYATQGGGGSQDDYGSCSPYGHYGSTYAPAPTYGDPAMAILTGGMATGALLLAATGDLNVTGTIDATPNAVACSAGCNSGTGTCVGGGPGGSGGGVKLVSTGGSVVVSGSVTASGGPRCNWYPSNCYCTGNGRCCYVESCVYGAGGEGRIRIEAKSAALVAGATITPAASVAPNTSPVVSGL